ncbi:putative holin-like toxin [Pullulanibacillus pueri]
MLLRKGGEPITVYEALGLMIQFAILVVVILSFPGNTK